MREEQIDKNTTKIENISEDMVKLKLNHEDTVCQVKEIKAKVEKNEKNIALHENKINNLEDTINKGIEKATTQILLTSQKSEEKFEKTIERFQKDNKTDNRNVYIFVGSALSLFTTLIIAFLTITNSNTNNAIRDIDNSIRETNKEVLEIYKNQDKK